MSLLEWGHPRKREFGHSGGQKNDHVKTQGEGGHLQAKEKGLMKPTLPNTLTANF